MSYSCSASPVDPQAVRRILYRDWACRKARKWNLVDVNDIEKFAVDRTSFCTPSNRYMERGPIMFSTVASEQPAKYLNDQPDLPLDTPIAPFLISNAVLQQVSSTLCNYHHLPLGSVVFANLRDKVVTLLKRLPQSEERDEYMFNPDRKGLANVYSVVFELLLVNKGKLAICGGWVLSKIMSSLKDRGTKASDIDMFFYNCKKEEAENIIYEATKSLSELVLRLGRASVTVKKQMYVTTISVGKAIDIQFIHRIYPTLDLIIGGFDIAPCSCAVFYDEKEELQVKLTEVAAWSIAKCTIPVDISRRSVSFEQRICKYTDRGFYLVFPGLTRKSLENASSSKYNYGLKFSIKLGNCLYVTRVAEEITANLACASRSCKVNTEGPEIYSDYGYVSKNFEQESYENLYRGIRNRADLMSSTAELNFNGYRKKTVFFNSCISGQPKNRLTSALGEKKIFCLMKFLQEANSPLGATANLEFIHDWVNQALTPRKILLEDESYLSRVENFLNSKVSHFKDGIVKKLRYRNHCLEMKLFGDSTKQVRELLKKDDIQQANGEIIALAKALLERAVLCAVEACERHDAQGWITSNPEMQGNPWTSSFHPLESKPDEFYQSLGLNRPKFWLGVDSETETALRILRKRQNNVFKFLNRDTFNYVMCLVDRSLATCN